MAQGFVVVPLKKSAHTDVATPLGRFIRSNLPQGELREEILQAAQTLQTLRDNAVSGRDLEGMLRYYDQLCAVEPKFPFSGNELCLNFTWRDAFEKDSLFGSCARLSLPTLAYEKTCVLFNVGALASQIASHQRLNNDENLKAAAKYYQLASGAFAHIKDTILSALSCEPTLDISPNSALVLSLIMLAQAQEMFLLKSVADKMKDAIIARLASQASTFYGDALKYCKSRENLLKYVYFQNVLPTLEEKRCVMRACAEYRQSLVARQQKKFGEEIARLQLAAELLRTVTCPGEHDAVARLADKVAGALTPAKKDNEMIYNERVPEVRDLESIGKVPMVKSTPIQVPLSQNFRDLFEKMVPAVVQQCVSASEQRKAEMLNQLVSSMREATVLLNGTLASLNLPAALEDLSGQAVPQSIMEKSRAVVQKGGLQSMALLISELPALVKRNQEILIESLKILEAEELTDNELRAKLGQSWSRTTSAEVYKPLRAEGHNCSKLLERAQQADSMLHQHYNAHHATIALLCASEAELSAAIPSASPTQALQDSKVVSLLHVQLARLADLRKEREQLEQEVTSAPFDMTGKFLMELAQHRTINEKALSLSELDRVYGGYRARVEQSLQEQEELLVGLQKAYEEFSIMKQSSSEARERDEVLKKLAATYDSYMEVSSNLLQGTQFHNNMTEVLLKFQNKCKDIVFVREAQRDELLKDLQESITQEPKPASTPRPPIPAPRTKFITGKPQCPERPPPHNFPNNAANSSTDFLLHSFAGLSTVDTTPVPSTPTLLDDSTNSTSVLPDDQQPVTEPFVDDPASNTLPLVDFHCPSKAPLPVDPIPSTSIMAPSTTGPAPLASTTASTPASPAPLTPTTASTPASPAPLTPTTASTPAGLAALTSTTAFYPAAPTTPQHIPLAQGPPYPMYPGFYPMPMYNPYGFGYFNVPYQPFQPVAQSGFPPGVQPQQPPQARYP